MDYNFSKIDWSRQKDHELAVMIFAITQLCTVLNFAPSDGMGDFMYILSKLRSEIRKEAKRREIRLS